MAQKPSRPRAAPLAIGISVLCLAVVGVLLFRSYQAQSAKRPPPPQAQVPAPAPRPATTPPTPLAVTPPALGRADLLTAAAAAASEHAAGEAGEPADSPLAGRAFRLRLPFGCEGPSTSEEPPLAYWTYAEDRQSIRVVVRPENWTDSDFARGLAGAETIEAVEGFWITRPWLASEDCPARAADPVDGGRSAPTPETVGLASVFEAGGSRVQRRRERPYETTLRVEEGEAVAPQGFRLLLEGRLSGFADGRAFRCRSSGPHQRPICIARVQISTVAIEDPATGRILDTWDTAQTNTPPP